METAKTHNLSQTELLSEEKINEALQSDMTAVKILQKNLAPTQGDLIGVRLNLNVLKSTGVAIQTLHKKTNSFAYKKTKGFTMGKQLGTPKRLF